MTIWFDVTDLFLYARNNVGITGIQRVCFEIYREAMALPDAEVGFVCWNGVDADFHLVSWANVEAVRALIAAPAPEAAAPPLDEPAVAPLASPVAEVPRGPLRRLLSRLDRPTRRALAQTAASGAQTARLGLDAVRRLMQGSSVQARALADAARPIYGPPLAATAKPGDTLCCIGAPWDCRYGDVLAGVLERSGLSLALLIHDLIPVVRPEFANPAFAASFRAFLYRYAPLAATLLTVSRSTARDLEAWAREEGLSLAADPQPIPMGTQFAAPPGGVLPAGLEPGGYVLFVSTLEIRKNHLQAFRIWQRLLREGPADAVPTLVFAGKVGWMAADLMQGIDNAGRLGGKLRLVPGPDDATLAALYRHCRFSLFPSHYEGWGLPVSESLAFGRPCIASDRSSLPEAGGEFCLYVDPDDTTAAYEVVRQAIMEPQAMRDLEAAIAERYAPTPWSEMARRLVEAVAG